MKAAREAAIRQAKDRFRSAFEGLPKREREVAVALPVAGATVVPIKDERDNLPRLHEEITRALKPLVGAPGPSGLTRTRVPAGHSFARSSSRVSRLRSAGESIRSSKDMAGI